jgi:hypothetical protein
MTGAAVWRLDSVRRDVDRDVREMMMESAREVRFVEWWDLLGLDMDKTVTEVRKLGG